MAIVSKKPLIREKHDAGSPQVPDEESITVDAVLYAPVPVKRLEEETVAEACTSQLIREGETATTSYEHDSVRWGNSRRGLSLLESVARHDRDISGLHKKNAAQEQDISSLTDEVARLREEMEVLKMGAEGFDGVRDRFISTYKRDVLDNADQHDRRVITKANVVVHSGDVLMDARIYKKRIRRDDETFESLYGLGWREVLSEYAEHRETLKVLSAHATIKAATTGSVVPPTFYASFQNFIRAIREGDGTTKWLFNEQSSEARAYYNFWKEHGEYKAAERESRRTGM